MESVKYAVSNERKSMTTEQCTFTEPWRGECGKMVTSTDPPRCEEHEGRTCIVCDETAVTQCDASHGMMCGAPLCADHGSGDCPHYFPT